MRKIFKRYILTIQIYLRYYLEVQCPTDYRLWQQTMYMLFGMKWVKIHAGPMWSEDTVAQGSTLGHSKSRSPTKVLIENHINMSCSCAKFVCTVRRESTSLVCPIEA